MIYSGELTKISPPHAKSQQRMFFLFNHQMVYCKKVGASSHTVTGCVFLKSQKQNLLDLTHGLISSFSRLVKFQHKTMKKPSCQLLVSH